MGSRSKRYKDFKGLINSDKFYNIKEAIELIKKSKKLKFDETLDIAINLGVDPRKSDQVVRGATVLPNGTGKNVRVCVFAQGENADKASAAGADLVGFEELAQDIKSGRLDFDVVIATPDAMRVVGQLGTILGPRGLMPNPKVGTVTPNVEEAVKNAKSGQVRYRTDKNGIIHAAIGKIGFASSALKENLDALISDLKKAKPASSKGVYFKKVSVSTTMGPGMHVDQSGLNV